MTGINVGVDMIVFTPVFSIRMDHVEIRCPGGMDVLRAHISWISHNVGALNHHIRVSQAIGVPLSHPIYKAFVAINYPFLGGCYKKPPDSIPKKPWETERVEN